MPGGIIPALAGNTPIPSMRNSSTPDHPRSRGEYRCESLLFLPVEGSSPLSRGIRGRGERQDGAVGIIPALAGNTGGGVVFRHPHGDHPRSRGEYQRRPRRRQRRRGIIPALAGNTSKRSSVNSLTTDHPRSRGEYAPGFPAGRRGSGSSPLSRGILRRALEGQLQPGIIPALAGNTSSPRAVSSMGGDHPRSRGEYRPQPGKPVTHPGSSPLSRGILQSTPTHAPSHRIIPALAGNTAVAGLGAGTAWDHPRSRGEYTC